MSTSQQKIKKYTKKHEKYGPFTGKKTLTETNPEEAQTLELLVKDDKSTVLNMLNEIKETMDKELKEIRKQCMNKIRTSIKKNYEKYNDCNKKFTTGNDRG